MDRSKHLLIILALALLFLSGCSTKPTYDADARCPVPHGGYASLANQNLMDTLQEIKTDITNQAGVEVTLLVSRQAAPNAYTWETKNKNFIAITLGLIQLLDENIDEYAFVIAHEVAHVANGHMKKKQDYQKKVNTASNAAGLALDIIGIGLGIPFSGLISSVTTDSSAHLINLGYSRDHERDADRDGLKLMIKAGFSPEGAISFHEKLAGLTDKNIPFLSSHPTSEERINNLKELIGEFPQE